MKYKILTLGCKVNSYESQFYNEQLEASGFTKANEDEPCDLYIINTCTVTNTAASKSRKKIHQAKKENPNAIVVAIGCYVQFIDEKQRNDLGVDIVIGANHKNELVKIVSDYIKSKKMNTVVSIEDFSEFESMPIHEFESKKRAFLKIQDGCNQYCSYCAIPYARGHERCPSKESVIETAIELSKRDHDEIVLTGIHTGRYQDGSTNLAGLLKELLKKTDSRIHYRISSIEITEVSDELIQLMKENKRICSHLHIPIQAACNETLARMNRPYTVEEFKERIQYIRTQLPNVSISTDVITGFVQESEEEFNTTVQNLKEIGFSFLHVFPYSKRNGTEASKMTGEIDGNVKKSRVNVLLSLSKELRLNDMNRFDEISILIENHKDNVYYGYTDQYHMAHVYSNQPLEGRINVKWDAIENETYIVKEG
ncbi:tRNA (N(6)-L-threonylcarbamoyladenosine(37)-C(2))-methylthiotransferase MtaB [Floccifex sp.]|uniref:tRNA (N(6)-L-threonylcarbamoyladenosine(37)-C(2))- methylthiotransferase MtaB n=1 Tax=Floccifex sp. TaxID=2815810 RepID=UPI002A7544DC|nr:tRNA (N(6)-L-threonylcarbamoyladenosine(37)-C(2))-methylthiotransferase MtaB [Floccifex sp.]MDY2957428.1 tRNA (N(6)-L-threonylcarbamoyladenosine(37)-C(2))-methylthiotransferase MtaB [Floccifex sp.]